MSATFHGRKFYSKEENKQLIYDLNFYLKKEHDERVERAIRVACHPARSLLDSSLISAYKKQSYNYKIIQCGNYYQVYFYNDLKVKEGSGYEKIEDKKIIIDNDYLYKKENLKHKNNLKKIEYKNIMRSKFELQRLVKSNESIFKTFITLTFADNVTDMFLANDKFHRWCSNIKKLKKDFAYVCVPEFQKRGAVHYHMLTNIDIKQNPDIIIPQKNGKKNCYDVKYWSHGFSSVFIMQDINVVGYITKYMTKDIDNRLWGHRRYLHSMNLVKPSTIYLNDNNFKDFMKLMMITVNFKESYNNVYANYDGTPIYFSDFKKNT